MSLLPKLSDSIRVTVVTAHDGPLWHKELWIPTGSTIGQSLRISGFSSEFPSISLETISVGIFGNHYSLDHPLDHDDRVEIYAPLRVDPKTARRRRAAHREKARNIKKKMPVNDLTQ